MKKLGLVLIIFTIGTLCFAQSNNPAQQIVGTWRGTYIDSDTSTFTFNSNGTFTATGWGNGNGNYFISGSKLILSYRGLGAVVTDYYFSSDGRLLVFSVNGYLGWFQKQ